MNPKAQEFGARVLFVTLVPVIVTAVALSLYYALVRYSDVEEALRQRGIAMARQLAIAAQYGLFSGNIGELNRLALVLSHEPDVSSIAIYDRHNVMLAAIGGPFGSLPPAKLKDGWNGHGEQGKTLSFHNKVFASSVPFEDSYSEKKPTPESNLLLGSVTVELSRNTLIVRKWEILIFTLGAALLILFIAGLIAYRLGRDVSEPIMALEAAVNKIRAGLLGTRVQPHSAGTLRRLEEGINSMAAALELAQMRNAEELSHSNTRLQQQNDFARALLEAQSNAGVRMAILEEGKVIFCNQAALDAISLRNEDLPFIKLSDVLAPTEGNQFESQYLRLLRGETLSSRMEVKLITPDGSESWAEASSFAITQGNRRQVVVLAVDITQRKLGAQRLQEAHEILQTQKEDAERSSVAKSRFIASASHDLRQPLHALMLFVDQLQQLPVAPELSSIVNQIAMATDNISNLMESLLRISRIDLETRKPDIRPLKLEPLLAEIAATHSEAIRHKGLRLDIAKTSLWIFTDPKYLTRIVSNLIGNALRYTEQGRILIGARRENGNVRIEIWDTGIGIGEDHLPFIFNEFYQVENPERDSRKGLGLGLAIVDRIAKALGHEISVRSKLGAGSVFMIHAPRAEPAETGTSDGPVNQKATRILLSINNENTRIELSSLLRRWGYSVQSFADAERDDIGDPPDLIICDGQFVSAPEDDEKHSGFRGIPIITIDQFQQQICQTVDARFSASIAVPVRPAQLRALILHLLARLDN